MSVRRVEKNEVSRLLEALKHKGYAIWAPQEVDGTVAFRPWNEASVPSLNYANSRLSPKDVIFPESERMFVFSVDRQRDDAFVMKEVPQGDEKTLIFGIRPCDARAFGILDKVFLTQGAQEDPYYKRRRDKTLLLGLGCSSPCISCFCHWTGGGPFDTEGLDLLMTELDNAYLLKPVSEKGVSLLDGMELPEASPEQIQKADALAREVLVSMGPPLDVRRIKERPLMEAFDDPFWETAHETCVKCGVCTYLCPTCSCFDIQDEVRGPCGVRGRNWDSCMFALTTLHASGHNPRPTGKERFRQRFMHKLKYFQDDFDVVMCVGCGRCVQFCPVNVDIREIISALSA